MAKAASLFLPYIIPHADACPDMLIERHVIDAAIQFCEDSGVYQYQMDPVSSVAGIGEYDLEPLDGTTVDKIFSVKYNGVPLTPIGHKLMDQRIPKREQFTALPQYYVKDSPTTLILGPIPAASLTNGLRIRLVLKPTRTSTSIPDELYNDYHDAILNLALFRLLSIPGKDWTSKETARHFYALYEKDLLRAKRRARQAEGTSVPIVSYGGL